MRETDPKTPLAAALRDLRKSRKLTQEALSEQSGIPQTTISNYERVGARDEQLRRYLDSLNATADERRAIGDIVTGVAADEPTRAAS